MTKNRRQAEATSNAVAPRGITAGTAASPVVAIGRVGQSLVHGVAITPSPIGDTAARVPGGSLPGSNFTVPRSRADNSFRAAMVGLSRLLFERDITICSLQKDVSDLKVRACVWLSIF